MLEKDLNFGGLQIEPRLLKNHPECLTTYEHDLVDSVIFADMVKIRLCLLRWTMNIPRLSKMRKICDMGEHCEIGGGRDGPQGKHQATNTIELSASESPEGASPENLTSGFAGLEQWLSS